MSGFGERFREAGYTVPKPLIEVDGKSIIAHVVDMFPGEENFTFICNEDHVNNKEFRLSETLSSISPKGNIVSIKPHKLGPVHAVMQTASSINDNEPVIVNYCDFTCYWDYPRFKEFVNEQSLDGSIPSYKDFHPHTLWSNYYAYLKLNDEGFVAEIQEKEPFTKEPQKEFASSGTYYFRDGKMMKEYFQECINTDLKVNGEYYVSMVYQNMIRDRLRIKPYNLEHFMQWGTPRDLKDYVYWSNIFKIYQSNRVSMEGTLLMPMAGLGSRFNNTEYKLPKPLIEVDQEAMSVKAYKDIPAAKNNIAVLRKDLIGIEDLKTTLEKEFTNLNIIELDQLTNGQAITCYQALKEVEDLSGPLTISACDNGVIFNNDELKSLLFDEDVDIIVWAAKGYPGASRNPDMYGWLHADENNKILEVSVKKPLSNPDEDFVIIGTFTYKNANMFNSSVESLIKRGGAINSEFYIDSSIEDSINQGLVCKIFEVEKYICWGTPNDLRTYEYWESCFSKWPSHPYRG